MERVGGLNCDKSAETAGGQKPVADMNGHSGCDNSGDSGNNDADCSIDPGPGLEGDATALGDGGLAVVSLFVVSPALGGCSLDCRTALRSCGDMGSP